MALVRIVIVVFGIVIVISGFWAAFVMQDFFLAFLVVLIGVLLMCAGVA